MAGLCHFTDADDTRPNRSEAKVVLFSTTEPADSPDVHFVVMITNTSESAANFAYDPHIATIKDKDNAIQLRPSHSYLEIVLYGKTRDAEVNLSGQSTSKTCQLAPHQSIFLLFSIRKDFFAHGPVEASAVLKTDDNTIESLRIPLTK